MSKPLSPYDVAYDKGGEDMLEMVIDAWNDTMQEEIECGVKVLSDHRADDLKHDYPVLVRFGEVLDAMRRQDNEL